MRRNTNIPYIFYLVLLAVVFVVSVYVQINPQNETVKAEFTRQAVVEDPIITSRAYLSLYVDENGKETVLTEKKSNDPYPIASITKLFTALVFVETEDEKDPIGITPLNLLFLDGRYRVGENLTADALLNSMLIESDNNAATILGEERRFMVEDMNATVKSLGLKHTRFVNATGLDNYVRNTYVGTSTQQARLNQSSARDVADVLILINKKYPYLKEILSKRGSEIKKADGSLHHVAESTNDLLKDPLFKHKIILGKTGETPHAKKNLAVIAKTPHNKGYLVLVILGSDDQFEDMRTLLTWSELAYSWTD